MIDIMIHLIIRKKEPGEAVDGLADFPTTHGQDRAPFPPSPILPRVPTFGIDRKLDHPRLKNQSKLLNL